MKLTVELLGEARRLAQEKNCLIRSEDQMTFRDVLRHVGLLYPSLVGPVIVSETFDLVSSYMLNVDGRRVVQDLDMPAHDGQRLFLMFLEAGG